MGVVRTVSLALVAGVAVAGTGCFGGTANPSYFPSYLPPGDIIATHAKPAGLGYFRDFDPKAADIQITPATCSPGVNTDHVLIATVLDSDGVPRRKRRVEWILEGPGEILEVDESGVLPGRGYLMSNQRAVSYTSYRPHTFERGNDDPADDFTIEAGQTWCIVRSALPGVTTVTAFAPEIHNHDRRTALARVTWGGGGSGGSFPEPPPPRTIRNATTSGTARESTPAAAVSRSPKLTLTADLPAATGLGRELAVTLAAGNDGGLATTPVTVRAELPAGAEFVRSEPAPSSRNGSQLTWALGKVAPTGRQTVRLFLRPQRKGELTLVASAETTDGLLADARGVTEVSAAALNLSVSAAGPAEAGGTIPVTVTLTNPGPTPVEQAIAFVTLPDGLEAKDGANPGLPVELNFGTVPGNTERKLDAVLVARKAGTFPVPVNVNAAGGIRERQSASVTVSPAAAKPPPEVPTLPPVEPKSPPAEPGRAAALTAKRPALMLDSLDFPETLAEGAAGQVRIVVRNEGTADAENVRVVVAFGDGVRADGGTGADRRAAKTLVGSVEFNTLDRLPPGSKAVFVADMTGVTAGPARLTATVTAAGDPTPLREQQQMRVTGR